MTTLESPQRPSEPDSPSPAPDWYLENDPVYDQLEEALARHKSQQGSLVYPTGYMANTGVMPAVAQKGDLILSDELNHASIIESCRLSGARVSVYRHNDMDDP